MQFPMGKFLSYTAHLLQNAAVRLFFYEHTGVSKKGNLVRAKWHEVTRSISTPPWMGC